MRTTPKTPGELAVEEAALATMAERDALEYAKRIADLPPEKVAEIEEAARYCKIPPLTWLRSAEKRSRWA